MKRIHVWACFSFSLLLVAISAGGLSWHSRHNGYNMVCGSWLDITYDSLRKNVDNLTGEMSLQIKRDYTGTLNISGDVFQDSEHIFHMFRSLTFTYTIVDRQKGLIRVKFKGIEFYPPDSEKNQFVYWPLNQKYIGKEMELMVNVTKPGLMLISNFYSPVINCSELMSN